LVGFNPRKREPELTRVLKAHVEQVTARQRGLLGMWATEGVINRIDQKTGELVEERRTDIVYGWNNEQTGIQLVFEFKKLTPSARDRARYLGNDGLGRFVTGIYSRHQAVAAMVGILTDPIDEVVPLILKALNMPPVTTTLRLRTNPAGSAYDRPSMLFTTACFDTEHDRDSDLAPSHGTIRVAHFFLVFGYSMAKARRRKPKSR
jgi:hypothetical protein